MLPIYLDHHATTPLDPRVLAAMQPYFTVDFGNASSRQHAYGWTAAHAVDRAREHVAALIGADDPKEIIFTSTATEANNLVLKGLAAALDEDHFVSVVTEHASVLEPLAALKEQGKRVTLLPVDGAGMVSVDAVRGAIEDRTIAVCVMLANNEIGTLQPLAEIAAVCRERDVYCVSDIVQAAGHIPVDVKALGLDAATLSAHKLHGPKGAGALWLRRSKPRVPIAAQIHGGGHERELRAGTLNVPAIVGFGEAARIARAELDTDAARQRSLRDRLFQRITAGARGIVLNGPSLEGARLPHNLNISIEGVDGEALLMELRDLAVSSGSACASSTLEASHVLRAIGRSDELAHAALRFGLGRFTSEAEIDVAADHVVAGVARLRSTGVKHVDHPER
ncbi:MAG: cysteine desulfurase [Deltaproteobacteria bacterium]|nr:cysteine desulfurase [Deltaproteobacteria bacterium]